MFSDTNLLSKKKNMVHSDDNLLMSPWSQPHSGSLLREDGHVYSLAVKNDVVYTGSRSKNIRVWKNMKEFCTFKSNSGLVKAIVISGDRIFTGHQDGRIRVWDDAVYKRVGTMPTFLDKLKASIRPRNYVAVKNNRRALWMMHTDAVSCLSINRETGLLYSASWDRTFKVWNLHNSKCIESVAAHDDAVNAIASTSDGTVYTGSADGTVKAWRREHDRHVLRHVLVTQECAVTALAVSGSVVYGGSSEWMVNFWERRGEHGGVLKGHKAAVLCVAAAGDMVMSGSADKTICVWRREGAEHRWVTVLTGHTGPVKCLAVEEDGDDRRWKVYSGSLDKSVKIWTLPPPPELQFQTPELHQFNFYDPPN